MSTSKKMFSLETALAVVRHPTVDSRLWAEAVEWLLLHGPPEVREVLLSSSQSATATQFPGLSTTDISPAGEPHYRIDDLARALGQSEDDIRSLLERKQAEGQQQLLRDAENFTIH